MRETVKITALKCPTKEELEVIKSMIHVVYWCPEDTEKVYLTNDVCIKRVNVHAYGRDVKLINKDCYLSFLGFDEFVNNMKLDGI